MAIIGGIPYFQTNPYKIGRRSGACLLRDARGMLMKRICDEGRLFLDRNEPLPGDGNGKHGKRNGQPRHNWKTLMFIPNVGIPWIGSLIYHSFCYIHIYIYICMYVHGIPRSKIDHDVIAEWDKYNYVQLYHRYMFVSDKLGQFVYSQNKLPEGNMNILVAVYPW